MRLTTEREKDIRNTNWDAYSGEACCDTIDELLAEIDALRNSENELFDIRQKCIDEIEDLSQQLGKIRKYVDEVEYAHGITKCRAEKFKQECDTFSVALKECLTENKNLKEDLKDWENDCNQDQRYIEQLQENQNTLHCALVEIASAYQEDENSDCQACTYGPIQQNYHDSSCPFLIAKKALEKWNG